MIRKLSFRQLSYNMYQIVFVRYRGKVTILKRKLSENKDDPSVVLQAKNASHFMKRMNWENKHLYGDILTNVSAKTSRNSSKYIRKAKGEKGSYSPDGTVLDPRFVIPIQEGLELESLNSTTQDKSEKSIMEEILTFPMNNILNLQTASENEDLVYRLNCLRQHLVAVNGSLQFPDVSTILAKTTSSERMSSLSKQKSLELRTAENIDQYQQECFTMASLQNNISMYLTGTPECDLDAEVFNSGYWNSLNKFFPSFKVRFLEEYLSHPFLCYSGILHCCGKYRSDLVVVEWKTSKKSQCSLTSTVDSPLVIAAHAGALNFDPKWHCKPDAGLIVVAFENGNPARVHYMDGNSLQSYWKLWLTRLKCFWTMVENSSIPSDVTQNVQTHRNE